MDFSIQTDVVVRLAMRETVPDQFEVIRHTGALLALSRFHVNMYVAASPGRRHAARLAERVRLACASPDSIAAE
jgi:hypothetical protein